MGWRLIYETVHGSRAYGLDRAGSDEDRRGVIVGPASWYFGFVGGPEQITHSDDHVWMEARKVVRLAAAANPTILEIFFTEPSDHRVVTAEGQLTSSRVGVDGDPISSSERRSRSLATSELRGV